MRNIIRFFTVIAIILCLMPVSTSSKEPESRPRYIPKHDMQYFAGEAASLEKRPMLKASSVDTFCIVWFDFEAMDWQGWTVRDNTAEYDTFFHVDDFTGLDGGTYGRLAPIEGLKSVWCGVRPGDDFYVCAWQRAPGYGNGWDQMLATGPFSFTGNLHLSYHGVFDSEPDWDFTRIEYTGWSDWETLLEADGVIDTIVVHDIILSRGATKLRFRFTSDGAWSDKDGLYDSDGACVIDSITVWDDNGVIDFEDFESYAVGETETGFWKCRPGREGFGSYAAIRTNLYDLDPCNTNFSSQIIFFEGSPTASLDYLGLPTTPFCKGAGGLEGPCQDEMVTSPFIDLTRYSSGCDEVQDTDIPSAALPGLGGIQLRFAVYRDLPLFNLVFHQWRVVTVSNGCPTRWHDREFVYYGDEKEYLQLSYEVGDLVGTDSMLVELVVADLCDAWYGLYGDCANHTPSPYFDNVRVYRYEKMGPQWYDRPIVRFQDTFPEDPGDIESFCRADMAMDINYDNPGAVPGDSMLVQVNAEYAGGFDTLGTGEPRIFCHVKAVYIGSDPQKPALAGPQLEGDCGSYFSDDGLWTVFHCDSAITPYGSWLWNHYEVDFNDSLFTRGYTIEYYFKAYTLSGVAGTLPEDAEHPDGKRFDFTCLPTGNSTVLFIDDFDGIGTFEGLAQTYMELALDPGDCALGCIGLADRYDINGPEYEVSNGPGSRAKQEQLRAHYETIIWDSGPKDYRTIACWEGDPDEDKSEDARMLVDWMSGSQHGTNLWILGDGIATDLVEEGTAMAAGLMSHCGVTLEFSSYFEMTGGKNDGGIPSPPITGTEGSPFEGFEYYAYGGCPVLSHFDVLEAAGHGAYAFEYPYRGYWQPYAGIYSTALNTGGYPMKTVWLGHSIIVVRDTRPDESARAELAKVVFDFFTEDHFPTGSDIPKVSYLTDNFPNPFNPSTRIKFGLSGKGHVKVRIYDVAGRLVRTLVDEARPAGTYEEIWDGTNDRGRSTASGIYFCRMEADDYERTLKMVLLR